MMSTAIVQVKVADVEPVASFIAEVCRAEQMLYHLPPDVVEALPEQALIAMGILQSAVRSLDCTPVAEPAPANGG